MKGLLLLLLVAMVHARGRVFQRFSPEILANMGYGGGHVGMYREVSQAGGQGAICRPQLIFRRSKYLIQSDNMIDEEPFSAEVIKKPCYGSFCISNEYCCHGTVCDFDGNYGRCVFVRGRRLGEMCRRDADCESGLICGMTEGSLVSTCGVPLTLPKQYNEECETSSDCDISRGLCCQLQRRHRQTHRKVRFRAHTHTHSADILLQCMCNLDLILNPF